MKGEITMEETIKLRKSVVEEIEELLNIIINCRENEEGLDDAASTLQILAYNAKTLLKDIKDDIEKGK